MTDYAFQPGDVVRLVTDGPDMVVTADHGQGLVTTTWFERGIRQVSGFPAAGLVLVSEARNTTADEPTDLPSAP